MISDDADAEGALHLAHRGTLLLEDLDALPAACRTRLLRVIERGEFDRPGDVEPTRVDVRMVVTTTLPAELFARLDITRIDVPPLRDRPDDIPVLAAALAAEIAARWGLESPVIPPATLDRLCACPWPGNVRELKLAIERALLQDPAHGLEALEPPATPPPTPSPSARALNLRAAMHRLEHDLILEAERRSGGRHKEAARLLGIDPRNLSYYLRKHRLAD